MPLEPDEPVPDVPVDALLEAVVPLPAVLLELEPVELLEPFELLEVPPELVPAELALEPEPLEAPLSPSVELPEVRFSYALSLE